MGRDKETKFWPKTIRRGFKKKKENESKHVKHSNIEREKLGLF